MVTETQLARAQAMEAHRQALIEVALGHEQVVEFLKKIHELLASLGRTDIEVKVQTHLKDDGVNVRTVLAYDSIFPRLGVANREEVAIKQRAEAVLVNVLKQAGIKLGVAMVIGTGTFVDRTHLTIFEGTVDYQGVFSEEE